MTCRNIAAGAYASAAVLSLALPGAAFAQSAPTTSAPPASTDEEIVVLSPFEVTASESTGYVATTTLAGSRINTQLKDVGSAVSVITSEFMRDTGATDNKTLLQYATGALRLGRHANHQQSRGANGAGCQRSDCRQP